jgi:hypothetical protein
VTFSIGVRVLLFFLLSGAIFSSEDVRPFVQKYCLDCHNATEQKGEVDLTHFGSPESVMQEFKLWQTVLQQVEEEEMPPKKPLPTAEEREHLVISLRKHMESIDWSQQKGVERVTFPRLTKYEYNNTLRDLLGIDFQPGNLLLDDAPGLSGFTNDRDALFISPALAEQLFDAAEYAIQSLLNLKQEASSRHYESEKMLMTERGAVPIDLPGGGHGYSLDGAGQRTLYDELHAPVDGWYRITVKHVGRGGDAGLRLRVDNEPRHDFRTLDGQPQVEAIELLLRAGTHQMTWNIENARLRPAASAPVRPVVRPPRGGYPVFDQEKAAPQVADAARKNAPQFPIPAGAGAEVKKHVDQVNRALRGMQMRIEYMRAVTPRGNPATLRSFYTLLPERTADMAVQKAQLVKTLRISPAEFNQRLLSANPDKMASNQKVLADSLPLIGLAHDPQLLFGKVSLAPAEKPVRVGAPAIDWIKVEGPITPKGAKPMLLFPADAQTALAAFLPRAFRRPVTEAELARHVALYQHTMETGESHDHSLKLAYTAALTSPSFLFRDELRAGELDDHQLANRLSYFLWMSMPDDELYRVADAGKLRDAAVLRQQVKRMVADPKARAFTSTFISQWLAFAGLGTEHVPDERRFREFTPALAEAMKLEPVLMFESLVQDGGSLVRLLESDETFVNADLARVYEIADISGGEMRKISLTDDRRGGLLGMAAVLTASSTPNRTSPVLRGKWVLENLLGRKLAEPPADAGQLDDKAGTRGKTLREELAEHRRSESCASCHDKIDPIGFALENFDAIGRFRTHEAGKPVDTSGELPGGAVVNGPAQLRAILRERHEDEFVRNVIQRLTAFALGRALKPQDEGLIRRLHETVRERGNRADALLEEMVLSEAFRSQGS